jgi:hypothetical protein
MAGGVHADHSTVEALFGIAFTATGKPFTSTQIDTMCVAAETIINAYLIRFGTTLPTTADTTWAVIVAMVVKNLMDIGDKWDKAGGSSSTASEMGTATYPKYAAKVLTPYIIDMITWRNASGAGSAAYGDSMSRVWR